MLAAGCGLFYETLLSERTYRFSWISNLQIPVFTAGFLLVSFSPIPPYFFQPVRFILVTALTAQFFYRVTIIRNLTFSTLLCSIYWVISALFASGDYLLPPSVYKNFIHIEEYITTNIFLCLMLIFHYKLSKYRGKWISSKWALLGLFPLLSLIIIIAIIMMAENGTAAENHARLTAIAGFAVINIGFFYFIGKSVEKEEEMQRLRLIHERTQNQMDIYRSMQKNYEQQRRQLHDYKNQLDCIQGMLAENQVNDAISYIAKLTGNLRQNTNFIKTNHDVVNIMLNRKYQEAAEKGIAISFAVNDLSELALSEEEIVTLLGNLLDNALAACEKLDSNKVIHFKMILENEQLILSVRNPVAEPVQIKENKIVIEKTPASRHGIGLLNVDSVIRKRNGTSVLKCDNGWFSFSTIIPV